MHRRYASSSVSPFNYINLYSFEGGGRELYIRLNDMEKTMWKEAERLRKIEKDERKRASFIAC